MQNDPAARVAAPAVGLMVTGGLNAVCSLLLVLLVGLFGVAAFADRDLADALPGVGVMMAFGVLALVSSLVTLWAGWQMRQFRGWGLSLAGAIAAMLPCTPCCVLGLPMGVWAAIVLIDQEVKAAFDSSGPPGGYGGPGYPPPG